LVSIGDIFTSFSYKFIQVTACKKLHTVLDLSLIKLLQNQQGCNFYAPQCTAVPVWRSNRSHDHLPVFNIAKWCTRIESESIQWIDSWKSETQNRPALVLQCFIGGGFQPRSENRAIFLDLLTSQHHQQQKL